MFIKGKLKITLGSNVVILRYFFKNPNFSSEFYSNFIHLIVGIVLVKIEFMCVWKLLQLFLTDTLGWNDKKLSFRKKWIQKGEVALFFFLIKTKCFDKLKWNTVSQHWFEIKCFILKNWYEA